MFLVDVLRGLVRPDVCLACGAPAAWPCCARCLPVEPDDVGPWPLAADPDVALWALGPYRDALRAAVLAGKLDGQPAALTELGRRLGTALAAAGVGADLVTYVAAGRVAGPPRDHAERVAAGVAAALDLPLVGLLAPAGGRDLGLARRAAHPDRPPPRRPPPTARYRLAGGRILLVDDLATTGGTLADAAATLRAAGARQVEATVLAAAPTAVGTGSVPPAPRGAGPVPPALPGAGSVPPAPRGGGSVPPALPGAGSVPQALRGVGSVPQALRRTGSVVQALGGSADQTLRRTWSAPGRSEGRVAAEAIRGSRVGCAGDPRGGVGRAGDSRGRVGPPGDPRARDGPAGDPGGQVGRPANRGGGVGPLGSPGGGAGPPGNRGCGAGPPDSPEGRIDRAGGESSPAPPPLHRPQASGNPRSAAPSAAPRALELSATPRPAPDVMAGCHASRLARLS